MDQYLADLETWLHSRDSAETIPAANRIRDVLKRNDEQGETIARHLLKMARTEKPKRNLFHLISARAFSLGENREIIPHLDGPYLERLARMSIPDDAGEVVFREHYGAVAYLKLHPDDYELYWRLRLAATRDAKVHLLPQWNIKDERNEKWEEMHDLLRKHYPRAIRNYGLRDAWDILLQLEILKSGMTLEDAIKILGEPTHREKEGIRWYHDTPRHVNPCLNAVVKDGKIVSFRNSLA